MADEDAVEHRLHEPSVSRRGRRHQGHAQQRHDHASGVGAQEVADETAHQRRGAMAELGARRARRLSLIDLGAQCGRLPLVVWQS